MGVSPKIGVYTPKMDGENNGLNPIEMDDLGGKPTIFGNIHISTAVFLRPPFSILPGLIYGQYAENGWQCSVIFSVLEKIYPNLFQL